MIPVLTDEQRREAAQRSLALRRLRAEFKAQLTEQGWTYLYENWDMDIIQGMKVLDLLRALPGVGMGKAASLMVEADIHYKRTVRRLGSKQKERLFAVLDR